MTNLEDTIRQSMIPEDAGVIGVKHLVTVRNREKEDFGSEVELKTDLDSEDVFIHTVCDFANWIFTMDDANKKLEDINILGRIVEQKERKRLSLDRKSRSEVVMIAKRPEDSAPIENKSFWRKMFTPQQ
jgi:hypothetical protein